MAKKSEIRSRIRKLMGNLSQVDFAVKIRSQPTTVNAWMKGPSLPSPQAYVALGIEAPCTEDSLFFFEQAGLTKEKLIEAADKLRLARSGPLAESDVYYHPVYRETEQGLQQDGSLIALPTMSVPDKDHFICLRIDPDSFGLPEMPLGLHIVDHSIKGTRNLTFCFDKLAVVRYTRKGGGFGFLSGLYLGTVKVRYSQFPRSPDDLRVLVTLDTRGAPEKIALPLGDYRDAKAMSRLSWNKKEERELRAREIWETVGRDFPLYDGISIVGKHEGCLPLPDSLGDRA